MSDRIRARREAIASIFLSLLFLTSLSAQDKLLFSGGNEFSTGQFVSLQFEVGQGSQPLLLVTEPDGLDFASHLVGGKLLFYSAMPNGAVKLLVLDQKTINGTIETTRHNVVIQNTSSPIIPTPDPLPLVPKDLKVFYDELLKVQYPSVSQDRLKIAEIFSKTSGAAEDAQKMIDSTFDQIEIVISSRKDEWQPYFVWLEKHLNEAKIKTADLPGWIQMWKKQERVFREKF